MGRCSRCEVRRSSVDKSSALGGAHRSVVRGAVVSWGTLRVRQVRDALGTCKEGTVSVEKLEVSEGWCSPAILTVPSPPRLTRKQLKRMSRKQLRRHVERLQLAFMPLDETIDGDWMPSVTVQRGGLTMSS